MAGFLRTSGGMSYGRAIDRPGRTALLALVLLSLACTQWVSAAPSPAGAVTPVAEPAPIRFESFATVDLPGKPGQVLLEEVTGGGGDDLVVVTEGQDRLMVYSGDGSGLFTPIVNEVLPAPGFSVAVSDFDGDLAMDYAVGLSDGSVGVYFGAGDGTIDSGKASVFTALGSAVHDMELLYSDLSDTLIDLVTVHTFAGTVNVLKSNGAGGFTIQDTESGFVNPSDVAVADFGSDWLDDFVVTDSTANTVTRVLNGGSGGGTFTPEAGKATGNTPLGAAIGYFNGDLRPDIITANYTSNSVSAWVSSGASSFVRQDTTGSNGNASVISWPFDNYDDVHDVVIGNLLESKVLFMRGSDTGEVFHQQEISVGTPSTIARGQANLDPKYDIAVGDFGNKRVHVFRNSCPPDTDRVSGSDRYATAVALSQEEFSSTSWVVIATGESFPDALAGVPLAEARNAPILLTRRTSLPGTVATEIGRLGATNAYILGSEGAVSADVESDLVVAGVPAGNIVRLGGADRYETSYLIAKEVVANTSPIAQKVVVATGLNYPDALAGGILAAYEQAPILLVRGDTIPAWTQKALSEIPAIASSYVLGGEAVVGPSVLVALPSPTRLSGSDRYGTAVAVADQLASTNWYVQEFYVATGQAFPDALAVGSAARGWPTPLILTRSSSVPSATKGYLERKARDFEDVIVVGGTGAIADTVVDEMKVAY